MRNFKAVLAMLLTICMGLCLCACVSRGAAEPETTGVLPYGQSEANVDAGKVDYTVTVRDEDGNPIPGVIVQWCLDTCFPGVTDDTGCATYHAEEADYHVQITSMPAGYTYSSDEEEFSYEQGSTEMTIVLKTED